MAARGARAASGDAGHLDNKLLLACAHCIRAVPLVVANALSVGKRHVKEIVPQIREFLPKLHVGRRIERHGEFLGALDRTFV